MNKKIWIVIIVIVILVILYFVYKKMFQNKTTTNNVVANVPLFNGLTPFEYHAQQSQNLGSLNTENINQNNNTDYKGYKDSLNSILAVLGYKLYNNGNTRIASATGKTLEKVQLKYAGNKLVQLEGNWNVDPVKWDLFNKLGLLNITYDSTSDQQSYIVYNKFIEFFGKYFFGDLAKQSVSNVIEAAKNSVPTIECSDEKLLRLTANLKDAGAKYQIAVFNINNVDNAENTQALNKTSQDLTFADSEYKKYIKSCKTN